LSHQTSRWWQLFCTLLSLLGSLACTAKASAQALRKTAIIVGANAAAPGRRPLRFSEHDAKGVAEVLIELGGFARDDVHVLLDPDPAEVLGALDRALAQPGAQDSLLMFYYSGHADAHALYPRGRALPLAELRKRLGDPRAAIRLGVIDACRGGGFTGAKGLTEVAPFEVTLPMALDSQGSILIASSSGLEDAHESEQLGGSFFTHHWTAALRGAGDRNSDGQVTLNEAFDYAKTLTIRDSAQQTGAAQHPSFSLNLHGRQDLALSTLTRAGAVVAVEQQEGPLELVHLATGVVVLELPKGPRTLRLAVAPGDYLLRRRRGKSVWTRELHVVPGSSMRVAEAALELQGEPTLAAKRSAPRPLTLSTLPRGTQEATLALGVSYEDRSGLSLGREFAFSAVFPRGLTDRLQWVIPTLALAYRAGEHGALEWIPVGGFLGWSLGYSSLQGLILELTPGAFLHVRKWLTPRTALTWGVGGFSELSWQSKQTSFYRADGSEVPQMPRLSPPNTWRTSLSFGIVHTLADAVTLQLSADLSANALYHGELTAPSGRSQQSNLTLGLGAVQNVGLRPAHLVQVHLSDAMALNLDAALHYSFNEKRTHETYLVGASFLW
jgi:Caspase domain